MTDQDLHRQELVDLYETYSDDYLLTMGAEDLTDVARHVLEEELSRRGLDPQRASIKECDFTDALLVVWSGRTIEDAIAAQHLLEIANITSSIVNVPWNRERERYQLRVAAHHAELAMDMLPHSSSLKSTVAEVSEQFLNSVVILPSCTACRSSKVVFVGAGHENCWQCEACGRQWEETVLPHSDAGHLSPEDMAPSASGVSSFRNKRRRILLNRTVVVVMILLNLFVMVTYPPRVWDTGSLIGLALWLFGLTIWTVARWQLGASFTGRAEARELVTSGIYKRLENPIYLSGTILIVGCCVYLHHALWLIVVSLVVPIQMYRVIRERAVLCEAFGERYQAYRASTWF